jgi:predicted CXXCH cytochrome family protein
MRRFRADPSPAGAMLLVCAAATLAFAETSSVPTYVGSRQCQSCHPGQTRTWTGSHHDLAMQEAKPGAVLGDVGGAELSYAGTPSRFSRRGDRFFVRTDGPDGKLADFEIAYAFGVDPLQQYLIALAGGRLQALSIAWDARPQPAGGQRWFHLYPDENVAFDDELHWTRRAQTWNHMCAECHSTGFEKRFDETRRIYESRWAEIDVACEACHGPGSRHLSWARKEVGWEAIGKMGIAVPLDERRGVVWSIDPTTGNASRSVARSTEVEIETCGRCHARRSQLFEDDSSEPGLLSSYLPALLREGIYHADGQIDAEAYEYGSFLQSRMYQAGVTCSDCHEPHTLALRAPGDAVCFQCHAPGKYASTGHHFHPAGSPGALPHAGQDLHGRRRAARPRLPSSTTRFERLARNAQRLRRLPRGADRGVGRRAGAPLARPRRSRHAALRGRARRRA